MGEKSRLILYCDAASTDGNRVSLSGWAISTLTPDLSFELFGAGHKKIPFELKKIRRLDASREILGDESRPECGFKITFDGDEKKNYTLVVRDGTNRRRNHFSPTGYTLQWKYRPFGIARDYLKKRGALVKTLSYEGFGTFLRQAGTDFKRREYHYSGWMKKRLPDEAELQKQRETVFAVEPKFSLIVPAFRTPKKFLTEMVQSVLAQTYPKFELCIADGSHPETEVAETLAELQKTDARIVYKVLTENKGISGNTNEALSLASGDWIVLMDHDDLLEPNALYELAKAINEDPEVSVVFTDEDKVSIDLKRYFHPSMKADFDLTFLESNNYICHLFAAKREITDRVGPFDPNCDGSQDHDYILRCTELGKVAHVPKVVYHWRTHPNSTAEDPRSKMYCYVAGARAVNLHYERTGVKAKAYIAPFFGHYETFFEIPEKPARVTVVMLGEGSAEDFERTKASFLKNSAPADLDFADGLSALRETAGEYLFFVKKGAVLEEFGALTTDFDGEAGVSEEKKPFPYNLIARIERGPFGLAGARIVDAENRLSYAGTVKNPVYGADYLFRNEFRDSAVQNGKILDSKRTASVSEDGFLIRRDLYEKLGGLDPDLPALSGLDLSLRAEEEGFPSVYEHTVVIRLKDRNDKLSPVIRNKGIARRIASAHAGLLKKPDPCSNPSMTVHLDQYELKENA
ncbi:MAG: glycosyltransferase [Lachnospiraceae bacterium]|nr:glycosyltransferase [Lachnospiraceae bacterium]